MCFWCFCAFVSLVSIFDSAGVQMIRCIVLLLHCNDTCIGICFNTFVMQSTGITERLKYAIALCWMQTISACDQFTKRCHYLLSVLYVLCWSKIHKRSTLLFYHHMKDLVNISNCIFELQFWYFSSFTNTNISNALSSF